MSLLTPEEVADLNRRLDKEWDTDRWLHLLYGKGVLWSLVLGRVHSPRWYALAGILAGGMLARALFRWCPLNELLRRMGMRERMEIERERYSLLAARDLRPEL